MADVSVIVVTPETGDVLDRCLASLARQTDAPDKVVLVLNGCGGTGDILEKWSPKLAIEVVELDRNEGFAGAHVKAIERVSSKWIALLNADAVAESDWIAEALRVGEEASDIGAVAVAVLRADDPSRFESLGIEVGASGVVYLSMLNEPYRETGRIDVFGAAGAAAFYRREAIGNAWFFTPLFFAYYEDVDLAWRLRRAGWRCVAAPRARVHHRGGAFSGHAPRTYYLHRNRLATILLNWPFRAILRNLWKICLIDVASVLLSLWRERDLQALKARVSFLALLPWLLLERSKRNGVEGIKVDEWLFDDREKAFDRMRWKTS